MHSLQTGLEIAGAIIVLFSLIPLVRNDFWAFRVFEYPRLQKLFLNVLILILYLALFRISTPFQIGVVAVLLLNTGYLVYQVFPFTFLSKRTLLKADRNDPDNTVSIISSNVYQHNKNIAGCLKVLKKYNPDIILLLETDEFWRKGTEELTKSYPYQQLVPLENTYGMLLYSRLKLMDTEVRHLVDEEIPSIKTCVELPSGKNFQLHCVHPTPPVPGENVYSTERDKELLLVAKEVKECPIPTIVVGDLNDVAWSYTTQLFKKISGTLDPREGRGFFNTFHARYPFLRFPLDHVFCTTHFKLIHLKRLENFSSDHFPILISLQYEPAAEKQQEEPEPDKEDLELAEEKISKETE
ncbi:endonuclease/exonuclease/phosphatase family protein [Dyadobacter sp. Leaf189]|uniref:endonuclease/exonuclease/phosphatase family protein n=1 Tax=Dyadobacter sp. Leaf189 TaxID=1736295 RepID=UPI0006F94455|nr:endonuclease/exonuclease/phosphatase family protein [Dyadobacter sp. Leaf189]KQS26949.1 endonuclease [Dyadobacter sp. Leaf189]